MLLVIVVVALTASTLITSLGVLVSATEQGGLRAELGTANTAAAGTANTGATTVGSSTANNTDIGITILKPSVAITDADAASESAVQTALGASVSTELTSSIARSAIVPLPELSGEKQALAYLGEYSTIRDHATLVSGQWPTLPGTIAVPDAALAGFSLALGDSVSVAINDTLVTVEIVASYTAVDPSGSFWGDDPTRGLGFDPEFPLPDRRVFVATNAMGPLLFAPGGMDAAGVTVARLDSTFQPNFSQVDVADLPGLLDRLGTADDDIPADMGDVGSLVVYFSTLDDTMEAAASGLIVTRSTVVVASLLLMVLAVAALAQTARLLFEGRAAERRLLHSRGASRRQVLLLSLIEAGAIGVVTCVASPVLALLVYRALAAQGPMREAGMPGSAPLSLSTLLTSVGLAVAFVLILVVPLLRASRTNDTRGARQRRFSGVMSSGLDIGLVALAVVAYWQLSTYRSPVEQSSTLAVDPLLVAGPALALLAGALLCMRFIPLFARLLERAAARSPGTLLPLAAWEVARRTQRAIAAVLLLTLALAVATFSLSFLTTWKQSQVDQADVAIGAPLRVPAVEGAITTQASQLASTVGDPQPTTRRLVDLAGPNAIVDGSDLPSGTPAVVMALTPESRALIADGRAGSSGGASLQTPLSEGETNGNEPQSTGIAVDADDLRGISATVQIGNQENPVAETVAEFRVVIESGAGLISTLSLGTLAIDGTPQQVSVDFDEPMPSDLRIVGFQVESITPDNADTALDEPIRSSAGSTHLLVGELAALSTDDRLATPLTVERDGWVVAPTPRQALFPELLPPSGDWQFDIDLTLPEYLDASPLRLAVVGWDPPSYIPAVISADLAKLMNISPGVPSTIVISGATVSVSIEATAPLIPGSGLGSALTTQDQVELGAIAVDQAAFYRALVAAGVGMMPLDEWWVDVPRGEAEQYLETHADVPGVSSAVSAELTAQHLQQGPLRVPTQAALWLAILAAAVLAAIGFAVHTAATLRLRNTELAQLRAIGFTRRSLVALVGVESAVLAALGTLFGITLGVVLGHLVGPLIAVSPTGRPTVPSVIVDIPWVSLVLLVVELAAVLSLVVVVVARAQKGSDPASILRVGD